MSKNDFKAKLESLVNNSVRHQIKEASVAGNIVGIQAIKPVSKEDEDKNLIKKVGRFVGESIKKIIEARLLIKEGKEFIISPKTPAFGIPMYVNMSMDYVGNTLIFFLRGCELEDFSDPPSQQERKDQIKMLKELFQLLEDIGITKSAAGLYDVNKNLIEGEKGMAYVDIEVPVNDVIDLFNRGGFNTRPYTEKGHEEYLKKYGTGPGDEEAADTARAALSGYIEKKKQPEGTKIKQ